MYSAIAVDPTKLTAAIPGCCKIASTASLSPLTTLNTPGGSPASVSNSAMRMPADGSRSDGFRMNVLPVASAIGNIHIGTIAGKLNGVIPAQTPSGWRTDQLSMPRPTCSVYSPFNRCGMPQANSTTSTPRVISPCASEKTLPCSSEMVRARLSCSRASSSRNLNMIRARVSGGVAAQPGNALAADWTAASISAPLPSATRRIFSPVARLNTSPQGPLFASARLPSMKCWMAAMSLYPQQELAPPGIISRGPAARQEIFTADLDAEPETRESRPGLIKGDQRGRRAD